MSNLSRTRSYGTATAARRLAPGGGHRQVDDPPAGQPAFRGPPRRRIGQIGEPGGRRVGAGTRRGGERPLRGDGPQFEPPPVLFRGPFDLLPLPGGSATSPRRPARPGA
ncbi:hypothetical protein ACFSTC_25625 [Nonomuraea ferruginea]